MKRFAVLTIAIVMSVLFAACTDANDSNVPAKQTSQSTEESTTSASTKESTTKSTSTERTTRASESKTTVDRTNETTMDNTETNFDDFFEEGTVSNGSGEGVIDQIGDDIMR